MIKLTDIDKNVTHFLQFTYSFTPTRIPRPLNRSRKRTSHSAINNSISHIYLFSISSINLYTRKASKINAPIIHQTHKPSIQTILLRLLDFTRPEPIDSTKTEFEYKYRIPWYILHANLHASLLVFIALIQTIQAGIWKRFPSR